MRLAILLRASPLLLLSALAASACGGSVAVGTGGDAGTGGAGAGGAGTGSFTACTGPGQCVLASDGCCESCGVTGLTGKTAINSAEAGPYQKYVCPEPLPCPACATVPDPNLFAYCAGASCAGADLRTDAASACTQASDCVLRLGSACCEPCSGDTSQVVAVNKVNDLKARLCAPDAACAKCLPQYPPDAAATCDAGHCAVVLAGIGGG
jgi:hypothetical protein